VSKLIPGRTVDAIHHMTDVILDYAGIDCELHIPTIGTYDEAEKLDVYSTPEDYEFDDYSAKVFINWHPDLYQLKRLGLFIEGQLPILVRFGNKAKVLGGSSEGEERPIDVVKRSYFRVFPEFIPSEDSNNVGITEFEIVNVAVQGIHDSVLTKLYSAVPRRVKI